MKALAQVKDNGQFFVLPEHRILFVSVAKNACTTMKWMLADIAGEDLSGARAGLASFTDESHIVHDRNKWKHSPAPAFVAPEILEQIHPDNGWFVFSVVRDPRVRFFSAWQDKLLLRNPAYARWQTEPWYPRYPTDPDDIVEDFGRFTDMLTADPHHFLLERDLHFRPQTELLTRDIVTYTHLYEMSELAQVRDDVAAHLKSIGWTGEVALRGANSTPLRVNGAIFADGVREKIEKIYAADLAELGDRWDFATIGTASDWSPVAIDEARQRAATNNRISELRDIAIDRGRQITRLRTEVKTLEKALKKASAARTPVSGPRRVLRRVRRLARRMRRSPRVQWR